MAIGISGRTVKARLKSELKRIESKKITQNIAQKYNHLRIQFIDGASRNFLFTDKQIIKAIKLANKKLTVKPKVSWVREVWYEGLIEVEREDLKKDISLNNLPSSLARKYNYIRINLSGNDISLLFSDSSIRCAIDRAKQQEKYLPKVSWLSDTFKDAVCQKPQENSEQKQAPKSVVATNTD